MEIKNRVEAIDKLRIHRALQDSPKGFDIVLNLLPLLFHYNHPLLAGFIDNCSCGISKFNPSPIQQEYLNKYFPAFVNTSPCSDNSPILLGVYSMGSVGTIAQTPKSDIDIWLCTKDDISSNHIALLNQKIEKVKQWALRQGVHISFYLINQQRFSRQNFSNSLSEEADNCGSAQNFLLLDEFYRSVIRLAGKPLLWLHIPCKTEQQYQSTIKELIQNGDLNLEEWVDFGGLHNLSASEYFGATLWQLYKCIDSPYKSSLKIILLESYFADFPSVKLISQEFKEHIISGDLEFHFDAYQSILERVKKYLSLHQDLPRLQFAYQCFYLKIAENYNKRNLPNWRLDILRELNSAWGWTDEFTNFLENHSQWKIQSVKQSNEYLLEYVMASYRKLLNFMHQNSLTPSLQSNSIHPQDLAILSRKLYTAFEKLPEKVSIFNLTEFSNLVEKDLTFVEVEHSTVHKKGWYLLTTAPQIKHFNQYRHCEYAKTLPKLIAWAYFNGILTNKTKIHTYSSQANLSNTQKFCRDLIKFFPEKIIAPQKNALSEPCKISQMFIAINLTVPNGVKSNLKKQISRGALLNFTGHCPIIHSLDAVYRNCWGEIRTLHFDGEHALRNLIKILHKKIPKHSRSLQTIQIINYNENNYKGLQKAVEGVIYQVLGIKQKQELAISSSTVGIQKYLWKNLFNPEQISKIKHYPTIIADFASEGFLQFFFEDNSDGSFNVYLLDEKNNIEIYHSCTGSKNKKILIINQLYQVASLNSVDNPYKIVKRNFNYPQFYQLKIVDKKEHIIPFQYH